MTGGYTYIVRCADGTLYTGWAKDVFSRVEVHNSGKGAKYTKTRRPVALVWYRQYDTEQEARSMECRIKKWTRRKKEEWIQQNGGN